MQIICFFYFCVYLSLVMKRGSFLAALGIVYFVGSILTSILFFIFMGPMLGGGMDYSVLMVALSLVDLGICWLLHYRIAGRLRSRAME